MPDEAGLRAAQAALELTRGLRKEDCVLFLISGGGSALFESPLVPLAELEDITGQLLSCGADIVEINTIRKRLSAVKGGRFALHCRPAPVFSVVLSDILGDPLDMIASGPAAPDSSTCAEALAVVRKYGLRLSDRRWPACRQKRRKHCRTQSPRDRQRPRPLQCGRAGGADARLPLHPADRLSELRGAGGGAVPCRRRADARVTV